MRKFIRTLCVVVTVALSVVFFNPAEYQTAEAAITSDSIKEKEEKIKESKKQQNDLKNNISNAKKIKQELEKLKADVTKYIEQVDAELNLVQEKLEELRGLISDKEAEIAVTTKELEEAIATEDAQYEAMKKHIKFIYEQGDTLYIDIMLSSKSFGDLLAKADYIDKLEAYDQKVLKEYREAREWTELCKATLESEKKALDEAKAAQEEEEKTLSELLADKETELANYNRDIANKNAQINELQKQFEEEDAMIKELEKQVLNEKKELAAQMGILYDGGVFAWPCPGYIRITDEFGYRTDPITGATSYHSGLDLGAPAGSAILAAYDGVVVAATYNWSMGNYIMIDHGGGLYTIYMHASKLYVKEGTTVVRGETIAAVGTTGRSTGNHLHFSVRLNGSYVSPWNYLKK